MHAALLTCTSVAPEQYWGVLEQHVLPFTQHLCEAAARVSLTNPSDWDCMKKATFGRFSELSDDVL